jgi:hypothetical protein
MQSKHFKKKANSYRYVLQEEYRDRVSFLQALNAHHNISFSCITYLNTSLPLLPSNSTDESRIGTVIQGFHGLQLYANKFWYKHLLQYCELQDIRPVQFSQELLQQLRLLLRFQKNNRKEACFETGSDGISAADQSVGLEMLDHLPEIKSMVSDVIAFKTKLDRNDSSDKDPDSKFWMSISQSKLINFRNFVGRMCCGSHAFQCHPSLLSINN